MRSGRGRFRAVRQGEFRAVRQGEDSVSSGRGSSVRGPRAERSGFSIAEQAAQPMRRTRRSSLQWQEAVTYGI